ncbi:MAG: cobalt ECF transporter T component CbiQ [Verrucomicrobiae bacterium]
MSLLSEIFSDLFARQDNILVRVDPRTKLIVALAALALVVFSPTPAVPLGVMLTCVATTVAMGVPSRLIALRLAAPMGIAAVLLVLQSVFAGTTPLWTVPALGITVTREGWHTGLLMASRVVGGMSAMLLLSSVTPAHRIFLAMRTLGMSKGWVEIAMLMYRYIFVLLDLTADVTDAQRVRLGYSSMRRGVSSAGLVAGVVVLRAVDQAVRTNEAMRARGYTGDIPMGVLPPLTWRDASIIAGAALSIIGILLAAEVLSR